MSSNEKNTPERDEKETMQDMPLPEDGREATLGEKRCHIHFNPSSDDDIGNFKRQMADAIDFLEEQKNQTSDPEAKRCFSKAQTELETAQMYGVKGIAKGL